MPFALPVQILLAQISVPALENRCQQSEFVFLLSAGIWEALMVDRGWLLERANTQLSTSKHQPLL